MRPKGSLSISIVGKEDETDVSGRSQGADLPPLASPLLKNCAILVSLALVARLWFNFGTEHVNAYSSADAAEYLRYATALSKLNWLNPQYGPEWKEFIITGPAFPFALWLFNFVTGKAFDSQNFVTPLVFQSLVSSLTCAFIYLTTNRLFGNKAAWAAGLLAVFYPAFIINTGRLYSETFATFVECACFALFAFVSTLEAGPGKSAGTKSSETHKKFPLAALLYFLLGLSLTVLQLTRSAMLLFTGATAVFVLAQVYLATKNFRAPALAAASLLLGLASVLLPWFVFENQAFHKVSLVVDRVGHYNLFIGTNTASQGFLSYPYPDGRGIEEKSFPRLVAEAYKKSPNSFLRLMLDKPARLYKFPWNDYRTPLGPIDYKWQTAYHQIILLAALAGLSFGMITLASANGTARLSTLPGKFYLLMAFALNLPYLAFITVPRYNLTAMPVLLIFAGAGMYFTGRLLKENAGKNHIPQTLLVSALFLFFYLRDDLSSFSYTNPVSVLAVQGSDLLMRSLIAASCGLVFFISLFLSLPLLYGRTSTGSQGDLKQESSKKVGLKLPRALTILQAICLMPLLLLPQRANGRFQERITTVGPPATIQGELLVPGGRLSSAAAIKPRYLLIDSDRGEILRDDIKFKINGREVVAPLIPGLAILDDWNQLKVRTDGIAYLECAYIFDCMTQAMGISNLDIRQWYLLPLPAEQFKATTATEATSAVPLKANSKEAYQIEIGKQGQLRLFGTAASPPREGKSARLLKPSLALYSWEKAFYGVENDSGLTDSRFDEKHSPRQSQWSVGIKDVNLPLPQLDANIYLLCQRGSPSLPESPPQVESQLVEGEGTVTLTVPPEILSAPLQLLFVKLEKPSRDSRLSLNSPDKLPTLTIIFRDKAGKDCQMPLPWLKNPGNRLHLALPLYLQKIPGDDIKIKLDCPDRGYKLSLKLTNLDKHPLESPELY